MKRVFIRALFALFLTATCQVSAQTAASPAIKPQVEPAKEGTFQLIRTGKHTEYLHTEFLPVIESKRHDTEVIYYLLSDNLTVKILPRSVVNQPGFVPLKELYLDEKSEKGLVK